MTTYASRRTLLPDGRIAPARIAISDGRIAAIEAMAPEAPASDLLLLPGIVDIHGDAFERQIMPRPGVRFAVDLALIETDRQLAANGITTAFHAVTCSWEPGLRGRDTLAELIEALERLRPSLGCDARLHLRYETYNLDAEREVEAWMRAGRVALLAFNDHTPGMVAKAGDDRALAKFAERAQMSVPEFRDLLARIAARRDAVPGGIERLARSARGLGVPLASHDDETPAMRAWFDRLGCAISEFPKTEDTAREARARGNDVIMGAPNILRGGSHLGGVSAAAMVAGDLCSIVASDYYYPTLLHGAFRLAREGVRDLAGAWSLVSASPARAAGLSDRGALAAGRRADFILVDDSDPALPRVAATVVAGRPVFADRPRRLAA